MPSLADLRRDYTLAGLSETDAGSDPLALFQKWFDQAAAANLLEPNAFTLATATPSGVPSARTVLLKLFDDRGFCFFTNYNSRKGDEMAANPHVAMMFLWHELERQVRIEGRAEKTTAQESDDYYRQRPLGSRLGAWSSPQSEVIAGRSVLEDQQKQLLARFENGEPPRPPHWGGYRIVPTVFEFWHGRPSRLHDRIRFRLVNGVWAMDRLAP
jgi:pyridoxamine 5'-phosphate oxidase